MISLNRSLFSTARIAAGKIIQDKSTICVNLRNLRLRGFPVSAWLSQLRYQAGIRRLSSCLPRA
ncbi:MAG: hypothetical protein WDZ60_03865, partial [Wenzhouxiangellaceae bacterium]